MRSGWRAGLALWSALLIVAAAQLDARSDHAAGKDRAAGTPSAGSTDSLAHTAQSAQVRHLLEPHVALPEGACFPGQVASPLPGGAELSARAATLLTDGLWSQGLDALSQLLDIHSKSMSKEQLGELRTVMRQMRSSKQRRLQQLADNKARFFNAWRLLAQQQTSPSSTASMFAALSEEDANRLFEVGQQYKLHPGQKLFPQGDGGRTFGFVLQGELVAMKKQRMENPENLSKRSPLQKIIEQFAEERFRQGDSFGSAPDSSPDEEERFRLSDLRASEAVGEETIVFSIGHATFAEMLQGLSEERPSRFSRSAREDRLSQETARSTLRAAGQLVQIYDPVARALQGGVLAGSTYNVILYELDPFVKIRDPPTTDANVIDPGNVNQTRTPANGMLSGFTIDMLEALSVEMDVEFKYFYPCEKVANDKPTTCKGSDSAIAALEWMKDGDKVPAMQDKYYGDMRQYCMDFKCFAASAIKVSAERVQDFRMTQPFLDTGFVVVVKEKEGEPAFMSAFYPFSEDVWAMVILEIVLVGMAFIYIEGYGTNEALWEFPDISELQ
jgi:ABC-type amino acid transport substrate-binding protein